MSILRPMLHLSTNIGCCGAYEVKMYDMPSHLPGKYMQSSVVRGRVVSRAETFMIMSFIFQEVQQLIKSTSGSDSLTPGTLPLIQTVL